MHTLRTCTTGVDGQYTVAIVSTPAGTPVSGSTNTFYYPILSSVTLTCMVTSNDGSPVTVTGYSWDTTGCYVNSRNENRCFPVGKNTASVSKDSLLAIDSGTITCTATISDTDYTSPSLTLNISGMSVMKYVIAHCTSLIVIEPDFHTHPIP